MNTALVRLALLLMLLGCRRDAKQESAVQGGSGVSIGGDSTAEPIGERVDSSGVLRSSQRFASPRRSGSLAVRHLWTVGGPDAPGDLIQPVSLAVSSMGVLVSEMDGSQVRVYREGDGAFVESIGKHGNGPGEFGRIPQLLGLLSHPLAFEGASGRISLLLSGRLPQTNTVSRARTWLTACAVGPTRVLLQHTGWVEDGYFVSTIGDSATLVDSLAYPFTELAGVAPLARQASLQQVDDSTCAILPAYGSNFAIYRAGSLRLGQGVEQAPLPAVVETRSDAGLRRRLADDVRPTFLSAAGWRGLVLVLHAGSSRMRGRLVDIYSTRLEYQGSILLPFRARFIAAQGDNLFVLGEKSDEPMLAAFRILRQ